MGKYIKPVKTTTNTTPTPQHSSKATKQFNKKTELLNKLKATKSALKQAIQPLSVKSLKSSLHNALQVSQHEVKQQKQINSVNSNTNTTIKHDTINTASQRKNILLHEQSHINTVLQQDHNIDNTLSIVQQRIKQQLQQQPESKIKLIDTVKVIKPVESIKSIPQKQSSKPVQSNDKLKLNAGNKFKKKQKK